MEYELFQNPSLEGAVGSLRPAVVHLGPAEWVKEILSIEYFSGCWETRERTGTSKLTPDRVGHRGSGTQGQIKKGK